MPQTVTVTEEGSEGPDGWAAIGDPALVEGAAAFGDPAAPARPVVAPRPVAGREGSVP